MYVGLGQAPMLHGSFAETLGANPLPPEGRKFLNQVRERRQDFKRLLLTVTFHPNPIHSKVFVKHPIGNTDVIDYLMFNGLQPVDVLDPLRRIRDDFQRENADFKRRIEAELQLRNEMIKTAGALGPDKLKPFLLEPLFPAKDSPYVETDEWKLCRLARNFAQMRLPRELAQRIRNSEASEAHLTNLGRFLRRYAEVLQTKDPAFKRLVDQEREKRARIKEEQQQQQRGQQRRRRP